jgi:hypothetical protein
MSTSILVAGSPTSLLSLVTSLGADVDVDVISSDNISREDPKSVKSMLSPLWMTLLTNRNLKMLFITAHLVPRSGASLFLKSRIRARVNFDIGDDDIVPNVLVRNLNGGLGVGLLSLTQHISLIEAVEAPGTGNNHMEYLQPANIGRNLSVGI